MLFTSLSIAFIYLIEFSTATVENEWKTAFLPLINGGIYVYLMLIFNILLPLLFIFKQFRTNKPIIFIISFFVLIGMWLERYVIIIIGQELYTNNVKNPLYTPSLIDWMLLAGAIGVFVLLFLIIARIIPINSITERTGDE
jgi:molybdopterin-containing oxidoreductase family membrane subunit